MEYYFKLENLNTVLILRSIQGEILKVSRKLDDDFYTMQLVNANIYYNPTKNKYWRKTSQLIVIENYEFIQEEYIEITSYEIENQNLILELRKDPLTKIGNRTALSVKENEILSTSKACVMVICDVDDFKNINDTYGHNMGDIALQGIAQILANSKRSEQDFISRIGGDEFFLIFETDNINDIIEKMYYVQTQVKILGENLGVPLFISIGLSFLPSYNTIYLKNEAKIYQKKKEADQALYYVKKNINNKNGIAYFNSETEKVELYVKTKKKIN